MHLGTYSSFLLKLKKKKKESSISWQVSGGRTPNKSLRLVGIFRSISHGNNNALFFLATEGHLSNRGFSLKSRNRDTGISPPARDLISSKTSPTMALSTGGQILREWRRPGSSCWNGSHSCAGNSPQLRTGTSLYQLNNSTQCHYISLQVYSSWLIRTSTSEN